MRCLALLTGLLCFSASVTGAPTPVVSVKEKLQPLQDLVGAWKVTGEPLQGAFQERRKGFWLEKIVWGWRFKGEDAWLEGEISDGKYHTKYEIRYVPEKSIYRLTAMTSGKETVVYEGSLDKRQLVLEKTDAKTGVAERLSIHLLHFNRYLCRVETRMAGKTLYRPQYRIGATKEGVPFANVEHQPECIVSGGLGTSAIVYKGKTYYVCCSGCRDAFNEEPEKYIREYEESKKKQK